MDQLYYKNFRRNEYNDFNIWTTDWKQRKKHYPNKYFIEVKPLLILYRIFGRFPYNITESGVEPFYPFSAPAIYCFIVYILSFITAIMTWRYLLYEHVLGQNNYDKVLSSIMFAVCQLVNIAVPVVCWASSAKFVRYIDAWQVYQEYHHEGELNLRLTNFLKYSTVITTVVAPFITYTITSLLLTDSLLFSLAYYSFSICLYHDSLIWLVTFYEIRCLASRLIQNIQSDYLSLEWESCRLHWLQLSRLTRDLGKALSNSLLLFSIMYFVVVATSVYGLAYSRGNGIVLLGHLLLIAIIFIYQVVIVVAARSTKEKVGDEFVYKLLSLNYSSSNKNTLNQVLNFVNTIMENKPVISLSSFVIVSNRFIVRFYQSIITYTIVLIQFSSINTRMYANHKNTDLE